MMRKGDLISMNYLLFILLSSVIIIGLAGYVYIAISNDRIFLRRGANKLLLLKSILFSFMLILLVCLSASILIISSTHVSIVKFNLIKLSFVVSVLFVLPIMIKNLFSNFLYKKIGKYFTKSLKSD